MALRSFGARVLQTFCYEVGGLLLVTTLYAAIMGRGAAESAGLMGALSVAILFWTPAHNTVFDLIDLSLSGRVASDRPPRLRSVHALSSELSTLVATVPIPVWLGGHGLGVAIAVDLGLTVAYTAYADGFFLLYDHCRPGAAAKAGDLSLAHVSWADVEAREKARILRDRTGRARLVAAHGICNSGRVFGGHRRSGP
ncbi:MAG: chlorhexidine efflux transporter [Albidovulum sp.]